MKLKEVGLGWIIKIIIKYFYFLEDFVSIIIYYEAPERVGVDRGAFDSLVIVHWWHKNIT